MLKIPKRMYPEERGYFAFPLGSQDSELNGLVEWMTFDERVAEAKKGNFRSVDMLLELYDQDDDWARRGAYIQLMGDAGPDSLLERMNVELAGDLPVDYEYDFAEALFYWGRLDAIPTLVELYRKNYLFQDAVYIPQRLSLLLEEAVGPLRETPLKQTAEEAQETCALALRHHVKLCERFGTQAFVFLGRPLDVKHIARCAQSELLEGSFDPQMRHKFETMTGIDCSSFYHRGSLNAPNAALVFEKFLAAPARLESGRRHFFGHPVSR